MNARDVIAKAAAYFDRLPHGMRYGLYDYSGYPGERPPHVVRDPSHAEVFRTENSHEAQEVYERLSSEHRGQFILAALAAAGYRILEPEQAEALDRLVGRAEGGKLNSDSTRVSVKLGDLRALGAKP